MSDRKTLLNRCLAIMEKEVEVLEQRLKGGEDLLPVQRDSLASYVRLLNSMQEEDLNNGLDMAELSEEELQKELDAYAARDSKNQR